MFQAMSSSDLSAVCSHLLCLPPSAGITFLLQHSIYSQIPPHLCSLFSSSLPKPLDKVLPSSVLSCSSRRHFSHCRLYDKCYRHCTFPWECTTASSCSLAYAAHTARPVSANELYKPTGTKVLSLFWVCQHSCHQKCHSSPPNLPSLSPIPYLHLQIYQENLRWIGSNYPPSLTSLWKEY